MEEVRQLLQQITKHFGLLNKNCCTVGGIELSLVQSNILYEIDRQHQPSIQQLADQLGMDITTFSRQVQTLVQKQLVHKVASASDKRVFILSLTTQGKFVATTIDHQVQSYLEQVFANIDESERDGVSRSLRLLNESMGKASSCCS
ncbi:MarR family winged helix-turn-helix transcriptional regulator [Cohnella sp. REN36]|uniref:MarR family winged helix-turn-helix transcriptional regulator n=1 Tax=Cohnella sp. REN36 TaxID=2887347 RepID=UPI001D15BCC2|nr:MarR family winged helix-turn-helix transcriptional regulator [Cohnella sp. REN36]MCC3373069.1 MarR family winged helix-turn-helix transcriptional regulator [Cohnella sp. REN36]